MEGRVHRYAPTYCNVYVLLPDIRGVSEVDLDAINGSDFDA